MKYILRKIKLFNFLIEETDHSDLLSQTEINALHSKINFRIVENGLMEAEARLRDALGTKATLEQKAFILLNTYTLASIAIFSLLGVSISTNTAPNMCISFIISSFMFCCAIVFLVLSLKCSDYGVLGSYPNFWLQEGTIDGDQDTHSTMLAYTLHDYQDKIWKSDNSNIIKSGFLDVGILSGVIAIVPLFIGLISQVFKYLF